MRRPSTPENAQAAEAEYLLDVVDRDSLDEEHQALHPKQWMTIDPQGAIQYFDTEDQACEAQRKAGPAYSPVPDEIKSDLEKVFARLSELGYKAFIFSYQEYEADSTCGISLSETEVVGDDQYAPDVWAKYRAIEIDGLSGSETKNLDGALSSIGERIADCLDAESNDWEDGRVVTLEGLLADGVAGVRVELLQAVERDEYRPFVLADQSERLKSLVSDVVSAMRGAGVDSLQANYDGGGDEGDFEDVDLYDVKGELLDEEAEDDLAEALGKDCVGNALWPILERFAGGWENNNGAHGEITINASGDVSIDHYDREDGLDAVKVVNWRVDAGGAPQVQLDSSPEM